MQLGEFLENFSSRVDTQPVPQGLVVDQAEVESQKLESFETGYKAGWDDAAAAQEAESQRIGKELGQNLQDLSFTYQEAYGHVLKSMSPLLEEIVNVFLPGMIEDALGRQLISQLKSLASDIGQAPVSIYVHPDVVETLSSLAEADFAFPVAFSGDASLTNAQAEIRFSETSKQIDLNEVLSTVRDSVEGFIYDTKRTMSNG